MPPPPTKAAPGQSVIYQPTSPPIRQPQQPPAGYDPGQITRPDLAQAIGGNAGEWTRYHEQQRQEQQRRQIAAQRAAEASAKAAAAAAEKAAKEKSYTDILAAGQTPAQLDQGTNRYYPRTNPATGQPAPRAFSTGDLPAPGQPGATVEVKRGATGEMVVDRSKAPKPAVSTDPGDYSVRLGDQRIDPVRGLFHPDPSVVSESAKALRKRKADEVAQQKQDAALALQAPEFDNLTPDAVKTARAAEVKTPEQEAIVTAAAKRDALQEKARTLTAEQHRIDRMTPDAWDAEIKALHAKDAETAYREHAAATGARLEAEFQDLVRQGNELEARRARWQENNAKGVPDAGFEAHAREQADIADTEKALAALDADIRKRFQAADEWDKRTRETIQWDKARRAEMDQFARPAGGPANNATPGAGAAETPPLPALGDTGKPGGSSPGDTVTISNVGPEDFPPTALGRRVSLTNSVDHRNAYKVPDLYLSRLPDILSSPKFAGADIFIERETGRKGVTLARMGNGTDRLIGAAAAAQHTGHQTEVDPRKVRDIGAKMADDAINRAIGLSDKITKDIEDYQAIRAPYSDGTEAQAKADIEDGVRMANATHAKEHEQLLTDLQTLRELAMEGAVPVNRYMDAWRAAGLDPRPTPEVNKIVDAAGSRNAQDPDTQQKRMDALTGYIENYRGTALFDEGEVAKLYEQQGQKLTREKLRAEGFWSNFGREAKNMVQSTWAGLIRRRVAWNVMTGDMTEAADLEKAAREYDKRVAQRGSIGTDDPFGQGISTGSDWLAFARNSAIQILPSAAEAYALGGIGRLAGAALGNSARVFQGLGIAKVAAEQGGNAAKAIAAVRAGLAAEAVAGTAKAAGSMTSKVIAAAGQRMADWGMKAGIAAASYNGNTTEYLASAYAKMTPEDFVNNPDKVQKATLVSMIAGVPAAAMDLLDGVEFSAAKRILGEGAKEVKQTLTKAAAKAIGSLGMDMAKEAATGFGQSVIGVMAARYIDGKPLDAPFSSEELKDIGEGALGEMVGGGVMHVGSGTVAKVQGAYQAWKAGRQADSAKRVADDVVGRSAETWAGEIGADPAHVAAGFDIIGTPADTDAPSQAALTAAQAEFDTAAAGGDQRTAIAMRGVMTAIHTARKQQAESHAQRAATIGQELSTASPTVQSLAKVASGTSVDQLTDAELSSVGMERVDGGKARQIRDVPALIGITGDGRAIVTDAGKAAVDAEAPTFGATITPESEARKPAAAPAPTNSTNSTNAEPSKEQKPPKQSANQPIPAKNTEGEPVSGSSDAPVPAVPSGIAESPPTAPAAPTNSTKSTNQEDPAAPAAPKEWAVSVKGKTDPVIVTAPTKKAAEDAVRRKGRTVTGSKQVKQDKPSDTGDAQTAAKPAQPPEAQGSKGGAQKDNQADKPKSPKSPPKEAAQHYREAVAQLGTASDTEKRILAAFFNAGGKALPAFDGVFPAIRWTREKSGSAGFKITNENGAQTLVISLPDMARHMAKAESAAEWGLAALVEEAIHVVQLRLEASGAVKSDEVARLLKAASPDAYKAMLEAYGDAKGNEAFEIMRMVAQKRLTITAGGITVKGVATEETYRIESVTALTRFGRKLAEIFQELRNALASIFTDAPPKVQDALNGYVDALEAELKALMAAVPAAEKSPALGDQSKSEADAGVATPAGGSSPAVGSSLPQSDTNQAPVNTDGTVDTPAHDAATSPKNDIPQPTPAQKEAGNYKMGHVVVGGMPVTIENPAGSIRSGKDKDGETWQVTMASHYGYVPGSKGKDGDHIDIFIQEGTPLDYSGPVFVVNQMNADGSFDEHKAVMGPGITTAAEAKAEYKRNYSPGWSREGTIAKFESVDAFRKWATERRRIAPAQAPKTDAAGNRITITLSDIKEAVDAAFNMENWTKPVSMNGVSGVRTQAISLHYWPADGSFSLSLPFGEPISVPTKRPYTRKSALNHVVELLKQRFEQHNRRQESTKPEFRNFFDLQLPSGPATTAPPEALPAEQAPPSHPVPTPDAAPGNYPKLPIPGNWPEFMGPPPGSTREQIIDALQQRLIKAGPSLAGIGHATGTWFDLIVEGGHALIRHNFTGIGVRAPISDIANGVDADAPAPPASSPSPKTATGNRPPAPESSPPATEPAKPLTPAQQRLKDLAARLDAKGGNSLKSAEILESYSRDIPREEVAELRDIAEALYFDDGIKTAEALAEMLNGLGLRNLSENVWAGIRAINASLPAVVDWRAIYSGIDKLSLAPAGGSPGIIPAGGSEFVSPNAEMDDIILSSETKQAKYHRIKRMADSNSWTIKEAQERVEARLVHIADGIIREGDPEAPRATFARLVRLYNNQPLFSARTSTSVENQAYSTPAPMAYALGRMTGVTPMSRIYDSTAGNGMLYIGGNRRESMANEINALRREALMDFGLKLVTDRDATKPVGLRESPHFLQPDIVHLNPPFGSIPNVNFDGFGIKKLEHIISLQALKEAMPDNGTAAIILGAKMENTEQRKGAQWVFENYLYGHYNVVDNFEVSGDLYSGQGASWPVRILIIAGRRATPVVADLAPKNVDRLESWDEVWARAERTRHEVESTRQNLVPGGNASAPSGNPGQPNSPRGPQPVPGSPRPVSAPPPTGGDTGGNRPVQSPSSGESGAGSPGLPPGRPVSQGGNRPAANATPPRGGKSPARMENGDGQSTVDATNEPGGSDAGGQRNDTSGQTRGNAVETATQVPYQPESTANPFETLIPRGISDAVRSALSEITEARGPIDEWVADSLGMTKDQLHKAMAAEQVDGVAMALYQMETGGALIIGDETGIGKGRQAAAMIRYAIRNGKIPLFFTKDPKLFSDMAGDLADIFATVTGPNRNANDLSVRPLVLGDKVKARIVKPEGGILVTPPDKKGQDQIFREARANGFREQGFNAIFATYSQINTLNERQSFIEWLTANEDVVVILDEAHESAGDGETSMQAAFMMGGEIKRGKGSEQTTITKGGLLNIDGAKHPKGGVIYLSATFAKRADNMPVYFRTDLRKGSEKFSDVVTAMEKGGVALQQAVTEALAEAGQYVRRERDFTGVSYNMKRVKVADEAELIRQVDEITDVLSNIVDFSRAIRAAAEDSTAMSDDAIAMTDFASIVHNQVGQLLLAAKADTVVDEVIAAKNRGEKPIVALMNTMESFLSQYTTEMGIKPGGEINLTWQSLLEYALSRTLRVSRELPNGDTVIEYVNPADYGLEAFYRRVQETAKGINVRFPVSPIDYIIQKARAAGVNVGELTGRESGIEYTDFANGIGIYRRFKKADKNTLVNGFNGGTLDGMLLNASGSTGLSIHASAKFKDQKPRHMIIAQPALDINVFIQTLGRIKRTGLVLNGRDEVTGEPYGARYTHLIMPLNAELRPAVMAARKMKSLNANTTGESDSAVKIEAEDLMNRFGNKAVAEYLERNPELSARLDLSVDVNADGEVKVPQDIARKFTGRISLLPDAEQTEAYAEITQDFRRAVEQAKVTGEYDLEIIVHDDWDGTLHGSEEIAAGTGESSIFTASVRVQSWEITDTRPTPSGADMMAEFRKESGSPEQLNARWRRFVEDGDSALERAQARLRRQLEESQAALAAMAVDDTARKGTQSIIASIERRMVANDKKRDKWTETKSKIDDILTNAGKPVRIQNAETGESDDGMLTAVKFPEIGDSIRLAPSGFKFTYLLNRPGGRIFPSLAHFKADGISERESDYSLDELEGNTGGRRERRNIIVGNPIKAYASTGGVGKVVRFKSREGAVVTGLMMPRSWNIRNLAEDPRMDLKDAGAVVRYIENLGSTPGYVESGENVRIGKGNRGIQMLVPAARRTGGDIFLDQGLRDIVGDFIKIGSRMVANVPASRLEDVVNRVVQITGRKFRGAEIGRVAAANGQNEQTEANDRRRPKSVQKAAAADQWRQRIESGDTIKSAALPEEAFYSQFERTIEEKMPARASAAQIIGILGEFIVTKTEKVDGKDRTTTVGRFRANQKAEAEAKAKATEGGVAAWQSQARVKEDELKWTGLIPWAEAQPQPISREAVLSYLRGDGAVRFVEVQRGERTAQSAKGFADQMRAKYEQDGGRWMDRATQEEMDQYNRLVDAGALNDGTKYGRYQLPGGRNYREFVLAMPFREKPASDEITKMKFGFEDAVWDSFTENQRAAYRQDAGERTNAGGNYKSSHFPDVPNYIAHMRLNEREDAAGEPGLFMEEVQSDRHQAGRDKGYGAIRFSVSKEGNEWISRYPDGTLHASGETEKEVRDVIARENVQGVPDAPFRTTWPLQMFKRALRDAVAAGKRWIGWTTGATQVERFDLSKQIDRVLYTKDGKLIAYAVGTGDTVINEAVPPEKLADYIGKEAAEKLLAQPAGLNGERVLANADLKVGGKGMIGFYDNILPKEVQKYVRQWGGKVAKGNVAVQNTDSPRTWEVTPEGARFGLRRISTGEIYRDETGMAPYFDKKNDATLKAGELNRAAREIIQTPIWRVDITPDMEAGVKAGQSLFSSALPEDPVSDIGIRWIEKPNEATGNSKYAYVTVRGAFLQLRVADHANRSAVVSDSEVQGVYGRKLITETGAPISEWTPGRVNIIVPEPMTSTAAKQVMQQVLERLPDESFRLFDEKFHKSIGRFGAETIVRSVRHGMEYIWTARIEDNEADEIWSGEIGRTDFDGNWTQKSQSTLSGGEGSMLGSGSAKTGYSGNAAGPETVHSETLGQPVRSRTPAVSDGETISSQFATTVNDNPGFANSSEIPEDDALEAEISAMLDAVDGRGGVPRLALSMMSPADKAVDEAYVRDMDEQSVKQWNQEADSIETALGRDEAFKMLAKKGSRSEILTPAETVLMKRYVVETGRKLRTAADRERAFAIRFAYRNTGGEVARAMRARVDEFMTPAERLHAFLTGMLFEPSDAAKRAAAKKRKQAEEADPKEADKLRAEAEKIETDDVRKMVAKLEADLKKSGFTIDEWLNTNVRIETDAPVFVRLMRTMDQWKQSALRRMQGGDVPFRKIAKELRKSEGEVAAVRTEFEKKFREWAMSQIKPGMTADELIGLMKGEAIMSGALPDDMSQADKERLIQEALRKMGLVNPAHQGKAKVAVRRNGKRAPLDPETIARMTINRWRNPNARERSAVADAVKEYAKKNDASEEARDALREKLIGVGVTKETAVEMSEMAHERLLASRLGEKEKFVTFIDTDDAESTVIAAKAMSAARGDVLDMVREYWYFSVLSGPKTQVVNAASYPLHMVFNQGLTRGLSALLNSAFSAVGLGNAMGPKLGELGIMWRAAVSNLAGERGGLADAWRLAMMSYRTGIDFLAFDKVHDKMVTSKKDVDDMMEALKKMGMEVPQAAIPGLVGKVIRSPMTGMQFIDVFGKTVIAHMEAAAWALRIARAEVKGKSFPSKAARLAAIEGRVVELMNETGSRAWREAIHDATEAGFQTPLDGGRVPTNAVDSVERAVAGVIAKIDNALARKGRGKVGFVGDAVRVMVKLLLLPFTKTPYNIVRIGLRKTPLGTLGFVARTIEAGMMHMAGKRGFSAVYGRFFEHLAEQILAWGAAAFLFGLAEGGGDDDDKSVITGGPLPGRGDRAENAARMARYGGDYVLRIGDRETGIKIPYGRYEPIATVMGTTIDMIRAAKMDKDTTAVERINRVMAGLAGQMSQKTFLKGLSDAATAASDVTGGSGERARQYGLGLLATLVPNVIKSPIRDSDDYMREWRTASDWYQFAPLPSNAQVKVVPGTGESVKKEGPVGARWFVPTAADTSAKLPPYMTAVVNYNAGRGGQPFDKGGTWAPDMPDQKLEGHPALPKGSVIELTPEVYTWAIRQAAGIAAKSIALSPAEVKSPSRETIERIRDAWSKANRQVRDTLRSKPPAKIGTVQ